MAFPPPAVTVLVLGEILLETAKLLAPDGAEKDRLGHAVAIDGELALAGTLGHDHLGSDSGAGYVFRLDTSGWVFEAELLASDGEALDVFGAAVALSGDRALVGAYGADEPAPSSGAAYVFERSGTTWSERAKLVPSDGAAEDFFGWAVALGGEHALVGAVLHDALGLSSGAVYAFEGTAAGWVETAKLVAPDGAPGDLFGTAVAISGDLAVVGAPWDDDLGADSGSAHVFERTATGWVHRQKLLATDGAAGDELGASVALSGDLALLGAPRRDDQGLDSGAAYVFERTQAGWVERAKLLAPGGAALDRFARSVSISGDVALVSADQEDGSLGHHVGAAHLFRRTLAGWIPQAKLLASDAIKGHHFAFSVAVAGDHAVVGAIHDDDQALDAGAAYVFDVSLPPSVDPYGCGTNPPGSLVELGGAPAVGATWTLGASNPLATQPPGSLAFLAVAVAPAPGAPCGVLLPGFGMLGPGASGELLVSIAPPDPVSVFGPTPWLGPGTTAPFPIPIPNEPLFAGLELFVQGLLVDPTGSGVPFGLTTAFAATIGS